MDELVKVLGQRAANDFKDKLEDQGIRRGRTFSLLEDKDIRQMTQGLGLGIRATADLLELRSNMRVQTTPSRPSMRSAIEELAAASPSAERGSGRRQQQTSSSRPGPTDNGQQTRGVLPQVCGATLHGRRLA